jgi:phage-related protein
VTLSERYTRAGNLSKMARDGISQEKGIPREFYLIKITNFSILLHFNYAKTTSKKDISLLN